MSDIFYNMPGTLTEVSKGQKQWKKGRVSKAFTPTPVGKAFLKPMAIAKPRAIMKPLAPKVAKPLTPPKPKVAKP